MTKDQFSVFEVDYYHKSSIPDNDRVDDLWNALDFKWVELHEV